MKLYPVLRVPRQKSRQIAPSGIFGIWLAVSLLNPLCFFPLAGGLFGGEFRLIVLVLPITLVVSSPALLLALIARQTGYIGWLPAMIAGALMGYIVWQLAGIGYPNVPAIVSLGVLLASVFWVLLRQSNTVAFTKY